MKKVNKLDEIRIIEKRMELLIGARFRDKKRILDAIKKQDALCKKYEEKASEWNSVEIIRSFRDSRCLS